MSEASAADSPAPDDAAPQHDRLGRIAWLLAPLGVALGSLALGVVALGGRSLSSDEAIAVAKAREPLGTLLSNIVRHDPGQAGWLLSLKLAWAAGSDELTLRLSSAVVVALAAGLLVVLGRMLCGRVAGLVAGIALAVNAGVVEASREVAPYAAGLLGIVVATLLFAYALEHGGGWRWAPYGVAAALLPLTHPLAASVLAAHGAALIVLRDRSDARRAGVALLAAVGVAAVLLAWMAADRFDAPDGAGTLDLERLARGLGSPTGWNPVLAVAAIAGLAGLFAMPGAAAAGRRWRAVLVAGLIAAPLVVTLLAAVALPVYAGALVLCAPGIALAAGAVAPLLEPARGLVWAGLALLLVASAATLTVRLDAPVQEDWRALATAVKQVRGARETVVVVPERSRAAFAFYAPYVRLHPVARRDGAWVAVVAGSAPEAAEAARPVVSTPRYALLRQFRYGERLRLQHWVRP